jgi:glycosyltransferase involved in cell wall biosynthesis
MTPHLCFVNSMRQWGGAEVWFLETALALQERGHRVSLVAQPGSELQRRAGLAGVPCAAIPIRFDAAPWTLARLWGHCRRHGVTAIVANRTKDLKAAAVAGRLASVPCILASRESDFPLKDKTYYRWYFQGLASGLLTASEATRRTVLASLPWLDPRQVHMIPKGIDLGRFYPAEQLPGAGVVGFVGQLIERKGLPWLMEAWTGIDRTARNPRPELRLAGSGVLEDDLRRWRQGLHHPEAVRILGFVEDIPAFFRGLDLLVMPSLAEGFGLAAAEAGACGLPVIAGRASSLPEIVVDGETGLLVEPRSAPGLEKALATLLEKPDLGRRMGQAGAQRVARLFDREQTLDRLLELTGCADRPHQG